MSDYEKLKQELEALRDKCKELEDKIEQAEHDDEPKFERVSEGEFFYRIYFMSGKAIVGTVCESYCVADNDFFDNNDYFKTCERAQEVADKINFLLRLERLRDTFCPDYKPDFDDLSSYKYAISYDHNEKIYKVIYCFPAEHRTLAYFPTEEIAKKVCDILNKENKQSACGD